jgi:hypothetical protein
MIAIGNAYQDIRFRFKWDPQFSLTSSDDLQAVVTVWLEQRMN